MESTKFVGMDVHKDAITIAVMNSAGKVIMESIIETKAVTILQFIQGLRGDLHVTFEEGTWATWLYDLLKPHVTKVVVCNPRKSALLTDGSKGDKIDARKLAELLRGGYLKPVYHGDHGLRTLKELSRSYLTISKDLTRVMNRIKALYRGWAIPCGGTQVYALCHRSVWLSKIPEAGVRRRAEHFYEQLDALQGLYSGLGLETHDSAQYRYVDGQLQRSRKPQQLRGLNQDHNHDLKKIFKGAATMASISAGPFHGFYEALLAKGAKPTMARLTLARKIAAVTLIVWKKGVNFDAKHLKQQAA